MWETWVLSLGWEDPLWDGMVTFFNILAGESPWTKESGRLQSMGSQRVGHDWETVQNVQKCICTYTFGSFSSNPLLVINLMLIRLDWNRSDWKQEIFTYNGLDRIKIHPFSCNIWVYSLRPAWWFCSISRVLPLDNEKWLSTTVTFWPMKRGWEEGRLGHSLLQNDSKSLYL